MRLVRVGRQLVDSGAHEPALAFLRAVQSALMVRYIAFTVRDSVVTIGQKISRRGGTAEGVPLAFANCRAGGVRHERHRRPGRNHSFGHVAYRRNFATLRWSTPLIDTVPETGNFARFFIGSE